MSSKLSESPVEDVAFETSCPVLFSSMENSLGVTRQWTSWKPRVLSIMKSGVVRYRSEASEATFTEAFKLGVVKVIDLNNNLESQEHRENGIVVHCQKMSGTETLFRVILSEGEAERFKSAVRSVAASVHYEESNRGSITKDVQRHATLIGADTNSAVSEDHRSIMRRAVASAMDLHDKRSHEERVRSKRGAFVWLPVRGANDLVYGSYWLAVGCGLFVLTSCVTLANNFHEFIGSDDSALDHWGYRSTSVLAMICGALCMLGKVSFKSVIILIM